MTVDIGQVRHDRLRGIVYIVVEWLDHDYWKVFILQGNTPLKPMTYIDWPTDALEEDEVVCETT